MNISRIMTSLAALNPFAVKVAAYGDTLVAYRNVLGMKFAVSSKAEHRAVIDYVAAATRAPTGINKALISGPLGFVDTRQGKLLDLLLAPKTLAAKRPGQYAGGFVGFPAMTTEQKAWLAWNKPQLEMTVETKYAYLIGKKWPVSA